MVSMIMIVTIMKIRMSSLNIKANLQPRPPQGTGTRRAERAVVMCAGHSSQWGHVFWEASSAVPKLP